jgi:hypothetical protein
VQDTLALLPVAFAEYQRRRATSKEVSMSAEISQQRSELG